MFKKVNVNRLQNAKVAYLNFSEETPSEHSPDGKLNEMYIAGVAEILEVKNDTIKVQWVEEVATCDMGSEGYPPEIYTQPNEYKLSDLDYCKVQHMSDAKIQQRRENALMTNKPFFDRYGKVQAELAGTQDFADAVAGIPISGEQMEQ